MAKLSGELLMNDRRERMLNGITQNSKLTWMQGQNELDQALSQRLAVCLDDFTRARRPGSLTS